MIYLRSSTQTIEHGKLIVWLAGLVMCHIEWLHGYNHLAVSRPL